MSAVRSRRCFLGLRLQSSPQTMPSAAEMLSGPRRMDLHQLARVTDTTVSRYKRAAQPFIVRLTEHSFDPCRSSEWDDLLVECKNDRLPKKSEFESLVASVNFLFPRFKGELGWAHHALLGWAIHHIPQHTVPLSPGPAHLVAIHMAALGAPRLGAGLLVQQHLGL